MRAVAQEVLEAGTGDAAPVVGGQCELRAGVVPMSKHPYGCRVIQRILEHCTLPDVKAAVKTQVPPSLPLNTETHRKPVSLKRQQGCHRAWGMRSNRPAACPACRLGLG